MSDFSSSYDSYDNSDASSGVVGFGDEGDVISDVVVSFLKIRYWTLHSAVTKLLLLILDVHIKEANKDGKIIFLSNDKGARIIARNAGLPVAEIAWSFY